MKKLLQACSWIIPMLAIAFIGVTSSCSDDGEGTPELFAFSVSNGEDSGSPIEGASVEVYTSEAAFINGDSPIKTFLTGAGGIYRSDESFPSTAVFFATSGSFNSWPRLGTVSPDPSIANRFSGQATVFRSFIAEFKTASTKKYVITDALLNGGSTFSILATCSKDNFIQLTLSKKFTFSEGLDVCALQPASTDYTLQIPDGKSSNLAPTGILNGAITYSFGTDIALGSFLYITEDFSQISTREDIPGGELIIVYTAQ